MMTRVLYDKTFIKSAKKLTTRSRKTLFKKIKSLQEFGISYKTLHVKALSGRLSGFYSFRLDRSYRCTFHFVDTNTILLDKVAHRKDIYN